MAMSASSFRKGDIYRGSGRNTAEAANQALATREVQTPGPSLMGSANQGAPMQGSPAAILACIVVLFVVLRIVASKAGDGDAYEGITPTFYNIMVITLAGLLGGTLLKAVVVKALPENSAMRKLIVQGV